MKKSQEEEDENWIIQYRKHKILEKFFRYWKSHSLLLNPIPLAKGTAVYAAFKWISTSFKNDLSNDKQRYHFPYHLTIETDGSVSTYLLSRIRQYAVTNINVSAKSLPLFIHATALLDAYQLMSTFRVWKSVYLNITRLKLRLRSEMKRKYFKLWFSTFLSTCQSRNSQLILSLKRKNSTLHRYFWIWNRTFRIQRYYKQSFLPSMLNRYWCKWKQQNKNSVLSHTARKIAENYFRLKLLKRSLSLWEAKLISLQHPILLLNSEIFLHSLLLCLKTKFLSSLRKSTSSEELMNLINSSQTFRIDKTSFPRILSMVQSNLCSSRSRLFLFLTADAYNKFRSLLRSFFRLKKLSLVERRFSVSKRNNLASGDFRRNMTLFRNFQEWKFKSFRNLALRKHFLVLQYHMSCKILKKTFGFWLVTSAKFQLFSRVSSIITRRQRLKELYFAWFAWRNQYERNILIKKNRKTMLLLRDQEIEEFANYMQRNNSFTSKQVILRAWALYVRDRSKGRRLYSVWFKFSGKFSVFQYFHHWKIHFTEYIRKLIDIQKAWRGHFVRKILFPKRVNYLQFFRRKTADIVIFSSTRLKRAAFSLLLKNLILEREKQLKVLRQKMWKRFYHNIFKRWKCNRRLSSKVGNYFIARARHLKLICLEQLVWNMRSKKKLLKQMKLIKWNVIKRKFKFWISLTKFKVLWKQVQFNFLPNKRKLYGWIKWYRYILRRRNHRRSRKISSLHIKRKLFNYLCVFARREWDIRNCWERNGRRLVFKALQTHRTRNLEQNHVSTMAAKSHSLWLKKKYLKEFRLKVHSNVTFRQSRKPILLLKYEHRGKSRRLNSHQRTLVNFFTRKFLLGNVKLASSIRKWKSLAYENCFRRAFHKDKLILWQSRRLREYFKTLLAASKRKDSFSCSKPQRLFVLSDQELKDLFFEFDKRNKHIKRFGFERAVKRRLMFSRANVLVSYHFFHKWKTFSWHLGKVKIDFQNFDKRIRRREMMNAFRLWNSTWEWKSAQKKLVDNYVHKKKYIEAKTFYNRMRNILKRKRRIRYLFKHYFQNNDIFKLNLLLQKWKKYFFLKRKKVFTVIKQQLPRPVVYQSSEYVSEKYNDMLNDSTFQYPTIHVKPKYQINQMYLKSEKQSNSESVEKPKFDPPSLFYYMKEREQVKFKFIGKLQRRGKQFFVLLREYTERKKTFRKTKWKPLKDRMKYYLLLQFRKFRSLLQKTHLYKQISFVLIRNYFQQRKLDFLRYWRKAAVLRGKFHQIQKRFFLFPLFHNWLLLTIELLKQRRFLSHFSSRRSAKIKSAVFFSWKAITECSKRNSFAFQIVQQRCILQHKLRIFHQWIILLDLRRLSSNFSQIQRKRTSFCLKHAFCLWQKAYGASELITWKNLQVGFRNWQLLRNSKHHQQVQQKHAVVFDYCRKSRRFLNIIERNYRFSKYLKQKILKLERKNFLKKLLCFFRIWKKKMYWKMRNQIKLSSVDKSAWKGDRISRLLSRVSLSRLFLRWFRITKKRQKQKKKRVYQRVFSLWKTHAVNMVLVRQAFVDRLDLFRRVNLMLQVWKPLWRNWLVTKMKCTVQKKRELHDLRVVIKRWKIACELLSRRRRLLEKFINRLILIPVRNLSFRYWRVKVSIGVRLKTTFLKKEVLARWRKLFVVTSYSRTYQLSRVFNSWKFILKRREFDEIISHKKRAFLSRLLSRKYSRLSDLVKKSFLFWRMITLASYYMQEMPKEDIRWQSQDFEEQLLKFIPRRRQAVLLATLRSSQAGRVFMFKDSLINENHNSSKIRSRTRFEKLLSVSPFSKLLDPKNIVAHFQSRCEAEYKQYHANKTKYQAHYYLKRNDPLFLQASVLESEDISLRKKLNIVLSSDHSTTK